MVKIQQIMKRLINTNVKRSVLLFAILLIASACKNSDKETEQPTPSVEAEILTLQPTDAVIDQTFPASLQGKDNVQLRPQISGYIDKIFVDEGAFVRAGQPLFRINASVYREQKIRLWRLWQWQNHNWHRLSWSWINTKFLRIIRW